MGDRTPSEQCQSVALHRHLGQIRNPVSLISAAAITIVRHYPVKPEKSWFDGGFKHCQKSEAATESETETKSTPTGKEVPLPRRLPPRRRPLR